MLPEYIDCDNSTISFDALLKSLITIDDNGNAALRVVENADSETPFYDCDNQTVPFENAIRKAVVLVNGLPALNLAVITPAP